MRRKFINKVMPLVYIALVLALVISISACASEEPTQETFTWEGPLSGQTLTFEKNKVLPGMESGEETQYFEWDVFGLVFEAEKEFETVLKWYPEEMAKRTEGHFILNVHWYQELCTTAESYDLAKAGTIKVLQQTPGYSTALYACCDPHPGMTNSDPRQNVEMKRYLFYHPAALEEMAETYNLMPILPNGGITMGILSRDKEITKVADMDGLMAAGSGLNTLIMDGAGAVVQQAIVPEYYEKFQKGMVDVTVAPPAMVMQLRLYEVADYLTMTNWWNTGAGGLWANIDAWNSLPQYIRDIHQEVFDEMPAEWLRCIEPVWESNAQALSETEMNYVYATSELDAELKAICEELVDKWVVDGEARGIQNAREIADDYLAFARALDKDPNLKWTPDIYDHEKYPEIYGP